MMRLLKVFFTVLLSICGLYSVAQTEQSASLEQQIDHEQLLAKLNTIRDRNNIAAVGLALVEGRKITYSGGLGTLSQHSDQAITGATVFRLGSITKTFTALAALTLAQHQRVDLNAPIQQWIPKDWYQNPWQASHPITLAQLLEHTAGFKDLSAAEFNFNDDDFPPLRQTLQQFKHHHKVAWPPGQHTSYTNVGAGFVGFIIEQISGQPYEAFVVNKIAKPLGMTNTHFNVPGAERLAIGYDRDGKTPIPYWHTVYRSFGGINSTADDMGRFIQALIKAPETSGKRPINHSMIQRMETPETSLAAQAGLRYGYGLGIYPWFNNGVLFYGHGGDADGYLSKMGYTRANDSGYFLVITAYNSWALEKMQHLVEEYLTQNIQPPNPLKEYALNNQQIKNLVGTYQAVTNRFKAPRETMKIITDNNKYYTVIDNRKQQLIPVTANTFRRKGETIATSTLINIDNDEQYFQEDRLNFKKLF